jgi:hypothetical protein
LPELAYELLRHIRDRPASVQFRTQSLSKLDSLVGRKAETVNPRVTLQEQEITRPRVRCHSRVPRPTGLARRRSRRLRFVTQAATQSSPLPRSAERGLPLSEPSVARASNTAPNTRRSARRRDWVELVLTRLHRPGVPICSLTAAAQSRPVRRVGPAPNDAPEKRGNDRRGRTEPAVCTDIRRRCY